jgi:hypothetical protein
VLVGLAVAVLVAFGVGEAVGLGVAVGAEVGDGQKAKVGVARGGVGAPGFDGA